MRLKKLKIIRVIVSLVFLISLSALFLDYLNILSPAYTNYFTYLQFVPSLIKFLSVLSLAGAGFIAVLAVTLLFGRIYCSSICPLGALQDLISYFSRKVQRKKYFKLTKSFTKTRYGILLAAVISYLSGSLLVINLLDPYSSFGRIFSQLFKPVLLVLNNALAYALSGLDIYIIYPVEIKGISISLLAIPALFLIIVLTMSFLKGRMFCNTVCPVGTLLGFMSRYSVYRIEIDKDNCIGCNLCERVCKSGCIDKKNKIIDFDRCVECYNCFTVCPTDGINFNNSYKNSKDDAKVDFDKRKFVAGIFGLFAGSSGLLFAQKIIRPAKPSTIPVSAKSPVSPPGSKSAEHFVDTCTACSLCISACPSQVLQPSFLEYGLLGIMLPHMDYHKSFCNFECIICTQVCPTGAILPVEMEKKKLLQLGKAKFVKDNCIVFTEKTDCGACAEHCPTKAVIMIPHENLRAPEVTEKYCIGCGACEYACPTKPYKAIYVEGNPVHLTVEKKEEKKIDKRIDYKDDFPF